MMPYHHTPPYVIYRMVFSSQTALLVITVVIRLISRLHVMCCVHAAALPYVTLLPARTGAQARMSLILADPLNRSG